MIFFLLLFFISMPLSADEEYIFADNEGLVITGTMQTTQQIETVERGQIENSGANDIVTVLQETLGLNIVRYGAYGNQAGINLRGFDSKRIAFLIDGVPVNSSPDGRFDINQIDVNSIERIEVIYGGADSRYNVSGAFGGIVNIVTIRRQEPGLRFTASVSNTSSMPGEYRGRNGETQSPHWEDLFDTQNFSLSAVYGSPAFSFTANIFANRAENHFLFYDYANYQRRKDNNEVWDTGANASFMRQLEDLTKIIASSGVFYSDRNFPASGFSSNIGNQIDFSARQNFMIQMPRALHDDLSAEISLSWQFHRRNYLSPANVNSLHDQHNFLAINRWAWHASEILTLRTGFDYRFITLDSTDIGNRNRHDGGIYLTGDLHLSESFLLIPSVKLILTNEGSENIAIIPKLGLLWNVNDNFAVRNNYFRNFKFPDFEELYWNSGAGSAIHGIGNPNLRPEDGWGADIGFAWHITETLRAENVFFTQWIKDSIHWFSGGGIWRPENIGEAFLFGIDLKIGFTRPVSLGPINKVSVNLSYQYLLSFLLSYGYSFESNKRIPYNPEHTVSGSLEFSWDSGSFSISARYEDMRFHDTANMTALKPVFLLNAGYNQRIGGSFTIFGALRNILNTSYESFYDYPMQGITLTLGVRTALEIK